MAKVGLKGGWTATYGETKGATGGITFTNGKKLSKAITNEINLTTSDVKLYADDAIDDSLREITSGTITVTPNDITEDWETAMGLATSSVTINGEAVEIKGVKSNTEGNYVAFGIVETKRKSGVSRYGVTIFPKVKFHYPDTMTANTRGENIAFDTPTITGDLFTDKDGNFLYTKDFETETAAIEFIEGLFGITNLGG